MTVSSTSNKVIYNGAGGSGPFSFSFKVFASGDLDVIQTNAAGVETTLTEVTHYSDADPTLPAPAPLGVFGWDALGTKIINYILQAGTSLVDLASSIGASLIGFIQAGVGAVLRSV